MNAPIHPRPQAPSPMETPSRRGRFRSRAGGALVALLVLLLWLPPGLPGLLDRIYYRGPVSAHFDGERFFNPEGEFGIAGAPRPSPGKFLKYAMDGRRAVWPENIPVTPVRPSPRIGGTDMVATWVGHSTVLVQTNGLNILTDPIWSQRASPFSFAGPKRARQPGIRFEDLPKIDLVLVSHNHYDHMDLPTLKRLWERDRPLIVTSLGNDTILRGTGITSVARDWGESVPVKPGVEVIIERVHHWDSRWMTDRNRALWSGFTVTLPGGNLFFTGDTGWGDGSWVADAARRGKPRLALIAIGAFRPREVMSGSHIGPEEAVEVLKGLKAKSAIGVHWGTFQLSSEAINEPRDVLSATLAREGIAPARFQTPEPGREIEIPLAD